MSQDPFVAPHGVVFDLDGTMTHNMPVHDEAFTAFMARHGLPPMTTGDRARFDGRRNRDIMPGLFGRTLSEAEQVAFATEKEGIYREISRGRLRALRGLPELLQAVEARGIPTAIATSAPAENVVHTLAEIGLGADLPVLRSDDLPRGKPFPDVFLAAAALLGVDPARCLAFEDALLGVQAARAAGMTVVGLTTSVSRERFAALDTPPHVCVADFAEFLSGPGRALAQVAATR